MNTSLNNLFTIVAYHELQSCPALKTLARHKICSYPMLIVIENSRTSFRSASSTACARTIYKVVPTTDIHYAEFELDIRSMENVKQAEALGVLPSSPVHGSRKQLSKNKTLCWTEEVHMQEKRRTGRRDPRTGKSRLPVKKNRGRTEARTKVAPQKLARRSKTKQKLARGILRLRHVASSFRMATRRNVLVVTEEVAVQTALVSPKEHVARSGHLLHSGGPLLDNDRRCRWSRCNRAC